VFKGRGSGIDRSWGLGTVGIRGCRGRVWGTVGIRGCGRVWVWGRFEFGVVVQGVGVATDVLGFG